MGNKARIKLCVKFVSISMCLPSENQIDCRHFFVSSAAGCESKASFGSHDSKAYTGEMLEDINTHIIKDLINVWYFRYLRSTG